MVYIYIKLYTSSRTSQCQYQTRAACRKDFGSKLPIRFRVDPGNSGPIADS